MATASALQNLECRATQAEEVISTLKSKLESIKQSAIRAEEERLRLENEELRAQVESLKQKLTLAEIKNGRKQVQMPVNRKLTELIYARPKTVSESSPSQKEIKPAKQKNKPNKKKSAKGEKDVADTVESVEGNGGKKEATPGRQIDISRLDLRVGKIVKVEQLNGAENLSKKRVDFGEGATRTVLSGLNGSVTLEEMEDRKAVFLCNLKPKRLRGTVSECVMLCAFGPEKQVEMLVPPLNSEIGDRVMCKDFPGTADARLKPRKKIWEAIKPDLSTNEEKVACYKGSPLEVDGKGPVTVPTLSNTKIL